MYINDWTAQNAALPTELSLRQVSQSQLDKGESIWPHHGVLVTAALPSHPSHLHTNGPLTFGFGWGFLLLFWFDVLVCFGFLVFFFKPKRLHHSTKIGGSTILYQLAVVLGTLGITLLSVNFRESTSVYLSRCFWFLLCWAQSGGKQVRMYQPDTFLIQPRNENSVKWKRKKCHPSVLTEDLYPANKLLWKRFTEQATQHKLPAQCCDRNG